ncbi:MAG: ribbon-helix-helix domain-containing protein, partial [Candidatus Nezhaarchaeales archaeon]
QTFFPKHLSITSFSVLLEGAMLRVVTFKLEEGVLEALVKRLGKRSRSELIKEAIIDLLRKYGVEVEIKPRPRRLPYPKWLREYMELRGRIVAYSVQVQ